jgi:O-antigen/teichoic acid export membrane protein
MSILKKLAGQAATYGVSSILGRLVNFLLVPFYTDPRTSGIVPTEFGIYSELYAYMAFLNIIYLFGMETTFFRYSNKEQAIRSEVYNTSQSAVILASSVFSGLIILFSGVIADLFGYPDKYSYIILLSLILFVDAMVSIPFARLRLENKAKSFAGIKLGNIFLNVFFNIFFLYFCRQIFLGNLLPGLKPLVDLIYIPDFEVGYIIVSNLLANALQLVFLRSAFSEFRFSINKPLLESMLKYAYPLMFMGLAGMVNEVFDRMMLRSLVPEGMYPGKSNLEVLGIYGACYKLSMFMSLAIQAFRYAAEPFFFSQAKEKNAPGLFAVVMKYFIITCTLIYVFVGCNLGFFGHILRSETYREGLDIVPVLLLANLFLGIYINLSVWYKLTDKTYAGTVITGLGALITVVANFTLIPLLGYFGAAVATLICYAGMAVIGYFWGQKHFPVPYKIDSAFFYISLSTLFIIFSIRFVPGEGLVRLIAGTAITLTYIAVAALREYRIFRKDLREIH